MDERDTLHGLFLKLDTQERGFVGKDDVKKVMRELGDIDALSQDQLKSLVTWYGRGPGGRLDYSELVTSMYGQPSLPTIREDRKNDRNNKRRRGGNRTGGGGSNNMKKKLANQQLSSSSSARLSQEKKKNNTQRVKKRSRKAILAEKTRIERRIKELEAEARGLLK